MTCVHLRQLYSLCQDNDLKFSSADLVHIVCKQCQQEDVCPSLLFDEYEARHPELASEEARVENETDRPTE